jgi:hypothetical protein
VSRLNDLKKSYQQNARQSFDLERELCDIYEADLKAELSNYKKFERLNNEKITPYFMKLVKQSCQADSLEDIEYDPVEYNSREESITGFYKKLYKKPRDHRNCTKNSIPEFLGQMANSPIVMESKLNDQEKNNLELPLSLPELDTAINQSNKKSAPGTDGISNKFIAKYWSLFRVPLFNYANACYERGELTANFRTAKVV